jgi:DNA-directed RNA polymerase specialized sigma24 family protein
MTSDEIARLAAAYRDATDAAEDAPTRRAVAVAEMHDSGLSYSEIGALIGVTRQRVAVLAKRGRDLRD